MKALAVLSFLLVTTLASVSVGASDGRWKEKDYVDAYCQGIKEYKLPNGKRIDCLDEKYATEYDWCSFKAYECIGQALYYATVTNRIPSCSLIDKGDGKCAGFVNIVKQVISTFRLPIKLDVISPEEVYKAYQAYTCTLI